MKNPDGSIAEFLGMGPRAKVLLLGVFHFAYPNLDTFKHEDKVDMLSERRRKEAAEVVERLAAFRPTKVAVEALPSQEAKVNEEYRAFREGTLKIQADEGHQISYPVAALMGHDRLYGINEWGRPYLTEQELLDYARKRLGDAAAGLSEDELWYRLHDESWLERGRRLVSYGERVLREGTLRDCLLFLNSDEHIAADHGLYLSWLDSEPGDYTMPDHITSWWYGRNIRIFANLKRITESPDDRILVVIGAGHIPILKHLVSWSPKHELVDVRTYLADAQGGRGESR